MTEVARGIKALKKCNPQSLFESIIGHHYPVALWKLPMTEKVQGLVDLRPASDTEHHEIENPDKGFLINPFDNHHPCNSQFLKADLSFEFVPELSGDVEIRQNPVIGETQINTFLDDLERGPVICSHPGHQKRPDYVETVKKAIGQIRKGVFDKVVLSRFEDQELPEDSKPYDIFKSACKQYPNAFVYLIYTPEHSIWIGATPEELLSINNSRYFRTVSLAGTQSLSPEQSLNEVGWTQKEIEEQAMVSRYVIDCFKKIRLREFDEIGPRTIKAGQLAHLKTEYSVDMDAVNMPQLGSVMMDLLHPTSAVCGMPLVPALEFVKSNEKFDRELFAGFIGPVNINSSSNLFVNIRCMKIMNSIGRFYAGAGITEDSNPEKELIETRLKMQTLKRVIFE